MPKKGVIPPQFRKTMKGKKTGGGTKKSAKAMPTFLKKKLGRTRG